MKNPYEDETFDEDALLCTDEYWDMYCDIKFEREREERE